MKKLRKVEANNQNWVIPIPISRRYSRVTRTGYAGLIAMLSASPFPQPVTDKAHLDGWEKWWKTATPPLIRPIYEDMPDEQSRCLARLAEWGFPDAVVKLYLHSGQGTVTALQTLARLGGGGSANSPFFL
jgi:hypothetical protein